LRLQTLHVWFAVRDESRFHSLAAIIDRVCNSRSTSELAELHGRLETWAAKALPDSGATEAFKYLHKANYYRGEFSLGFAFVSHAEYLSRRVLCLLHSLDITVSRATVTDEATSEITELDPYGIPIARP
jgi:hypothetical protein